MASERTFIPEGKDMFYDDGSLSSRGIAVSRLQDNMDELSPESVEYDISQDLISWLYDTDVHPYETGLEYMDRFRLIIQSKIDDDGLRDYFLKLLA